MSEKRILPEADPRVETGTVQFGQDWPGLFIRGDHASHYAKCLDRILSRLEGPIEGMDVFMVGGLQALLNALRDTRVKPRGV